VHGDFEEVTQFANNETFIYMDPPYRPLSGTSSFNSYQKAPFNDESQRRLANWFKALDEEKNAHLMLSNSDPKNTDLNDDFFDDLYKPFNIKRVSASRAINSKGSKRGSISELLITNYVETE
jgi:DNA adenine methylase